MPDNQFPVKSVQTAIEQSAFLRAVAEVRQSDGIEFALGSSTLRALTETEIAELEQRDNHAQDWSRVRVATEFQADRVSQCWFSGEVVLGSFESEIEIEPGLNVPTGLVRATIINSVIGHNAAIRDVVLLSRCVIGAGAAVIGCGQVSGSGSTSFGNGYAMPLGVETGGRDVAIYAEIDVPVAEAIALAGGNTELLSAYSDAVKGYVERATSTYCIIAPGAVVRHTAKVQDVYVGEGSVIDGATCVSHSTLLSNSDERAVIDSGAAVTHSVMQWGCHVSTMALVDHSVLTEHSHVERHGKVTDSLVGPNSGVAEGEVTASLLGPFVGFHHQALLIASLWPQGKGNVGYGANVGSNHTSKAPDQELWAGEGTFFGLGVSIKFPSDFSQAPYQVFASGVSALPQKITFPFSLINSPRQLYPGISPAYNEIMPAWLLTDNMFTLMRNEGKYKARNKARRTEFDFEVFRPDTVDLMQNARRRLESISDTKEIYTERDIPGLGKNFMLESARQPAIDAYLFYTKYYALLGLKYQMALRAQSNGHASDFDLLTTESDQPTWEHQRLILHQELGLSNVEQGLRELAQMLTTIAQAVEDSKAKDDIRGRRIIDDYAEVHPAANEDSFVKKTWDLTAQFQQEIEQLLPSCAT